MNNNKAYQNLPEDIKKLPDKFTNLSYNYYPQLTNNNEKVRWSKLNYANYNEQGNQSVNNGFNCFNSNANNDTYANCTFNTDPRAYFGLHYGQHIFDTNEVRGSPMNPPIDPNEYPTFKNLWNYNLLNPNNQMNIKK